MTTLEKTSEQVKYPSVYFTAPMAAMFQQEFSFRAFRLG